MYSLFLGSVNSLAINLADIFTCLGLPCFSAKNLRVKFSLSRSVHLHCHNSPILKPVSFRANMQVPIFLLQPATNASTSRSNGTNGSAFSYGFLILI